MSSKSATLNKEWHLAHPMPKNPTTQQRIDWHVAHLKHCGCGHDIPPKLKAEITQRRKAAKKYAL